MNEITKEIKQPKVAPIKEAEFISLKDLTASDVKKLLRLPFTFKSETNKKGRTFKTITFQIHDTFMKQVNVTPDNAFLTSDRFDLILLSIDLPMLDVYGKPNSQWNRNVPVRFVKGKTKNDSDYFSMEMIFKQYMYETHFFNSDQRRTLQLMQDKGLITIDWIVRPDAIDDFDSEDVDFQ